jgi:hypothetical protein
MVLDFPFAIFDKTNCQRKCTSQAGAAKKDVSSATPRMFTFAACAVGWPVADFAQRWRSAARDSSSSASGTSIAMDIYIVLARTSTCTTSTSTSTFTPNYTSFSPGDGEIGSSTVLLVLEQY